MIIIICHHPTHQRKQWYKVKIVEFHKKNDADDKKKRLKQSEIFFFTVKWYKYVWQTQKNVFSGNEKKIGIFFHCFLFIDYLAFFCPLIEIMDDRTKNKTTNLELYLDFGMIFFCCCWTDNKNTYLGLEKKTSWIFGWI